ncbi:MAG: PEP/pyruvate-binding domain-containing protein [Pseudonocardiaceae bacterium]
MTLTNHDLVVPLSEVTAADVAQVGAKAATLGALRRAEFPVPRGAVLTTTALQRALAAAGLAATASPKQVQDLRLPRCVADMLAGTAGNPDGGLLAVRSSGVDEDLPGASYAGQYDSVLGVAVEDLPDAVGLCWASAFAPHAIGYRVAHGGGQGPAMAVLVQPMVPAEAAGVAFSADPITGDRDTVVINAVRGLGDRLVGGAAPGDEWLVHGATATCRAAPEGALDAATARAVAALARRVETYFGVPQDIEWALAGGELVLLAHAAIIAREYAVPAVVATGNATELLHDGQVVTVDGSAGSVQVHHH